ncbi:MAG: serine protease, partial [Nostocaceae cyanobacterium CSU_2_110]|nr:serine protease [Nostocaceae cyanobacterium CSU_2_110]
MKFINLPKSVRQLSTHLFAILIGVLLSVNTLSVLPSQAEPAPIAQTPSNAA